MRRIKRVNFRTLVLREIRQQLELVQQAGKTLPMVKFGKFLRRHLERIESGDMPEMILFDYEYRVLLCTVLTCPGITIVGPFSTGEDWTDQEHSCGHLAGYYYCPIHPKHERRRLTYGCCDCQPEEE